MGSYSSSHSLLALHHSNLSSSSHHHHPFLSLYLIPVLLLSFPLHCLLLCSLFVAVELRVLAGEHIYIQIPKRMRNPKMTMKQDFTKVWTRLALKECCKDSSKYISVMEKQNAIKKTAAIAMAVAKRGSTSWSRAILASEFEQMNNELLGFQYPAKLKHLKVKSAHHISSFKRKLMRSKRVIRSTKRSMLKNQKKQKACSVAKSIIKKQTQVLKGLLPGGETMDERCLIGEALDYIVSLKAQVDVMKELVIAAEYVKTP